MSKPKATRINALQPPALPSAVGITYIRTYATTSPDGFAGGSAHVHMACTEAYYITRGKGVVQTLSSTGYAETELKPGRLAWFTPGTIHRLVNIDGELEILVVMQNAGLPEAGDFVLVFPTAVLADADEYRRRALLSGHGGVGAGTIKAAYRRRDLSIEGFTELKLAYERRGEAALREFYTSALALVSDSLPKWRTIVQSGPMAAAANTEQIFSALGSGDITSLLYARLGVLDPGKQTLGMCGVLDTYRPEGVKVS